MHRHCGHERRFNPTTYFKDHLIRNCEEFRSTPAWKTDEVQKEVLAAVDKDIAKRVRQACVAALCWLLQKNCI
jgi:hypothetical protein